MSDEAVIDYTEDPGQSPLPEPDAAGGEQKLEIEVVDDTPEPDIYTNEQASWRKGKMLRALLTVRYADGTTDTKVTGTDWRTTASETTWSAPFGGDSSQSFATKGPPSACSACSTTG